MDKMTFRCPMQPTKESDSAEKKRADLLIDATGNERTQPAENIEI